jgi:hypothetical protein
MRYVSTRGLEKDLSFESVIFAGKSLQKSFEDYLSIYTPR